MALFILLLFIFPLAAERIPLQRLTRQIQPQHNAPPPHNFPAFQQPPFGTASFPAQAFASKLAGHPHEGAQQPQPQFIANNGPLIRTSDGQFVLAPSSQQQFQGPNPHFPPSNQPQQFGPSFHPQQPQPSQFIPQQQQQQPFPTNPTNHQLAQSLSSSTASKVNNNSLIDSNLSELPTNDSSTITTGAPTSSPPPVDKSVDLDGDGVLSLNEVQYAAFVHHGLSSSVVENLFNEVDHNRDGFLTAIEFNDIRPLVLAKAENAALRYLQNVDLDHNGLLSLQEAQAYILREYGISNRDVERIWRLVVPSSNDEMDAILFSKLRRRVRGMSIRLARQIMKGADRDQDGQINLREAQMISFEQEGIGPAEVVEMLASIDDNNDGELNAPEFADFERIVRAKAVETSKKALKVVDTDGSGSLTMDEAKKIAFDHYGFDEATLEPFFAQADENEDGQLDAVEFAGFRSVIRSRAVKNSLNILPEMDDDGDGMVSEAEAEQRTRREDDMSPSETHGLFSVADQDRNGLLDKVELADFIRLVRLTSIKFVADHFREYDTNRDKLVTIDELERLVKDRYKLDPGMTRRFFDKVDVDRSSDLNPGEIVDFRHEVRRFAQDRVMQAELEEQNKREMAEIEQRLRQEAEARKPTELDKNKEDQKTEETEEATTATEKSKEMEASNSDEEEEKEERKTELKKQRNEEESSRSPAINETGTINKIAEEENGSEGGEQLNKTTNLEENTNKKNGTKTNEQEENAELNITTSSPSSFSSSSTLDGQLKHITESQRNESDSNEHEQQQTKSVKETTVTEITLPKTLNSTTMNGSAIGKSETLNTSTSNTTTKKQRKRRRKSTTPAITTTTSAAGESYEDSEGDDDEDGQGPDQVQS